jgi:citrate lyase subunit beta/citryl-CoA lyase
MTQTPLDIVAEYPALAPCEHIAGNERFITKALAIQRQMVGTNGTPLFDITLDLEDGAAVGQEDALARCFRDILASSDNTFQRCGVRIHALDSPHYLHDLTILIDGAASQIAYITVPKVRDAAQIRTLTTQINERLALQGITRRIPLHLLIETHEALETIRELAHISEVETLDFGLMDFISQCAGAIPADCMRSPGQFEHPLLRHVKSSIALAALGAHKIPSHNVTVEFRSAKQAFEDARLARTNFGYLRMWSIHPDQIEPIIEGISPTTSEVAEAREIIEAAEAANWGPITHNNRLHDRASYRYYWSILQRHHSGAP